MAEFQGVPQAEKMEGAGLLGPVPGMAAASRLRSAGHAALRGLTKPLRSPSQNTFRSPV